MMEIDFTVVSAAIINFVVLYLILRHFFFKPVTINMNNRKKSILDNINKAKEDMEKAEILRIENENILKEAKTEGKKIAKTLKEKANKRYEEIVEEANNESQAILERSRIEIEREKEKARNEIKTEVVDLALMLSSKALEESIDEEKHRKLIEDFLAKVGS